MDKLQVSETNVKNTNNQNLSADSGGELTPDFWKNFAESIWEKETFVKRKDFVTPPITEQELFKCVVDMSVEHNEARDAGQEKNDIFIFIRGRELDKDYAHLLPNLDDGSFADYGKRVRKALHGESFTFVIDAVTMPASLKVWTHNFLKDIYRPLGAMSLGNFWSIFFGDYSTTPFGVHYHSNLMFSEGAFYFPIVGKKEMTVWPASYGRANPGLKGAVHYVDHLQASTRLSAESGGMMYWPSDRWHIGSSEGGDVSIVLAVKGFNDVYYEFLNSTVNLDILSSYKPSGPRKWLGTFIEVILLLGHIARVKFSKRARQNQVRNLPCDVDNLQSSAEVIPEALKKIGRRLNIRFYYGKNIEKALSTFWMFHLTNLGTESHNAPFPSIRFVPELEIKRSVEIVLLWRQVDSETLLLLADRYVHEIPLSFLPLVKYISDKEAGQEIVYNDLVALVSELGIPSQKAEDELARLLAFLGESGTFKASDTVQ